MYDITASVPAVIAEITGGSPVLYVREPNGALIARKAGTDRKYYHFDELGSTLFLTDAGAVQTDKYVYNAFGGVITRTGSTNQPYQYIGQYGYYTHWQDANMPLLQLGVRFYNPAAGIFTQRDPVLDGVNWYSYTHGLVISRVDPSGMFAMGCLVGGGIGALNGIIDSYLHGRTFLNALCLASVGCIVGGLSEAICEITGGLACKCVVSGVVGATGAIISDVLTSWCSTWGQNNRNCPKQIDIQCSLKMAIVGFIAGCVGGIISDPDIDGFIDKIARITWELVGNAWGSACANMQ